MRHLIVIFVLALGGKLGLAQSEFKGTLLNPVVVKPSAIVPPIPGLDIPKETYSIDPSEGGLLHYKTGTAISIPKDAFVDAFGDPITEPVNIKYREFHDPIDFLVSGIPMTYDSGGVSNTFESAGMFELKAYAEGQEVFLKGGSNIEMDFASSSESSAFNFYTLNETTGEWTYKGKAGEISSVSSPSVPSYDRMRRVYRGTNLLSRFDTKKMNERFYNGSYARNSKKDSSLYTGYLNRPAVSFPPLSKKQREEKAKKFYDRKVRKKHGKTLFVRAKRRDGDVKGDTYFYFMRRSGLNETHPLARARWHYKGDLNRSEFRKKFVRRRLVTDIRVEFNSSTNQFDLYVKGVDSIMHMPAEICQRRNESDASYAKRCLTSFKLYERSLNRKVKRFDQSVEKEYKKREGKEAKHQKKFWNGQKRFMSKEERAMDMETWMTFNDSMYTAQLGKSAGSSLMVTRSFNLSGFGVFNCDQIRRMNRPVLAKATCADQTGESMKAGTVYVIDKGINGVFSFYGQQNDKVNLKYSPSSNNALIAISGDGSIGILNPSEFKAQEKELRKGNGILSMNILPGGNLTSVADIRNAAGL